MLMAILPELKDRYQKNPQSLLDELGGYMPGTYDVSVRGSTAIIPIRGLIFPGKLQRHNLDLQAALENSSIESIVLDIDSGGGFVGSVYEFVQKIKEADKPVAAYIRDMSASAAYWIASAADEVVIDPIARAGSIGVVATFIDWSKFDERVGIEEIEIINTDSPLKRADPTTAEGREAILAIVDDMAEVFITDVAENRNTTREAIAGLEGNVFVGEQAVAAGLADRTGSLEGLLTKINEGNLMKIEAKDITKDFLAENCPGVVAVIRSEGVEAAKAEGKAEGVKLGAEQERARITALDALKTHGSEKAQEIVAAAKEDPEKTASDVAIEVLAAIDTPRGGMGDIEADAPNGVEASLEEDDEATEMANVVKFAVAGVNKARAVENNIRGGE